MITANMTPDRSRRITMTSILLVLLSVALVAAAQIVLKIGMQKIGPVELSYEHLTRFLISTVSSPLVITGAVLFVISSLMWMIVLSREQLSHVQPFGALVYLLVLFFSWMVLKEDVNLIRVAGVIVTTAGVVIVAMG
jgi:uncharacterized membrane protein